jgi:acetyl esterase/lipase
MRHFLLLTGLAVACRLATAQAVPYPPQMEGARVEVYKTAGEVPLNLYVFEPPGHSSSDRRPAIVFFFGGGWRAGSPQQFEQQSRHLAARGMVAITADYRVSSRNQTKAIDCLRDAKSAIRWVRQNAPRLGIDAARIAAGGGSAGGHLAAATALISGLDEANEDAAFSSRPNALVLFNPVLVLAPADGTGWKRDPVEMRERAGIEPADISPYHHVSAGAPPTIIFHGKADTTVPYRTAEAFTKKMKEAGNRCELLGYEGRKHGFFNYGRDGSKWYAETLRAADQFLTSLGYLRGRTTASE